MPDAPDVETVEESEDYYHVRFRDPDEFDQIRTPDWAAEVAESVSEDAEVHTGEREGSDDWEVQSVLIPKDAGEENARERARETVEKIRS